MLLTTEATADQIALTYKRVLITDDNPEVLDLWERVLKEEGFAVVVAKNGREAIEKLGEEKVSVIFTDLDMPGMGGMDVLKYVKQSRDVSDVCVNIITGVGTIQGAVKCMQLGACDYISKPCDIDELIVMTYRCLRHHSEQLETKRLKETVGQLEELNKLKSDFVSNVSHELRTPLFSMSAALDLLLQDMSGKVDGPSQKLSEVIKHNHERLNQIVGNILDFSRLENGTLKPKFQKVDLIALAKKTLEDLSPLFSQHNIGYEFIIESSSCESIEADPVHLQQVLINLLGNSIKFTPAGGRVGVKIADGGDKVRVCVWDTGSGIAPEYLERIFDRFYQVDGSMTREAGGAGIGLSIVKAMVEMHGGKVWAASKPNQGSQFYITLPKLRART